MRDYPKLFAILKRIGSTKEEAALLGSVDRAPENKTESLRELNDSEFNSLMTRLERFNQVPPGDKMRKSMIAMARQMRWYKVRIHKDDPIKVDMKRIDDWCIKYGQFKKPLMGHNVAELATIVTTFKRVLTDFLTSR